MKIQFKKIQQGSVLAKGEDGADNSCGYNGIEYDEGCIKAKVDADPS